MEELKVQAATVFQPATRPQPPLPSLDFSELHRIEADPALERRIVGRDDTLVAALIRKIGNSDWVKRGVPYLQAAEGRCPFCQQPAPAGLEHELNCFFDEHYETDLDRVQQLLNRYRSTSGAVEDRIGAMLEGMSRFLDLDASKARHSAFRVLVDRNLARLASKQAEPSTVVVLERTEEAATALAEVLDRANSAIAAHNATMADLQNVKRKLTTQIWRYVVEERKTDLATYASSSENIEKAIRGLELAIESKERA